MSIVFGPDAFVTGADAGILVYDTNSYVYGGKGSGTNATVNATNDRVQQLNTSADILVRIHNAAVPTTGDGIVSMDQSSAAASDSVANPACRMKTDDTANCYMAYINNSGDDVTIYRCDDGSFVSLSNPGRAIGLTHTVTFKGVTNGAQVDLTLTISGLVNVTVADTHANRKLDGTPGFHMFCSTANAAWLDNLSVDDTPIVVTLVQTHYRWRNDDGDLTAP